MGLINIELDNLERVMKVSIEEFTFELDVKRTYRKIYSIISYDRDDSMITISTNTGTDYICLYDLLEYREEHGVGIPDFRLKEIHKMLRTLKISDIELHGGSDALFKSLNVGDLVNFGTLDNKTIYTVLGDVDESNSVGRILYIGTDKELALSVLKEDEFNKLFESK